MEHKIKTQVKQREEFKQLLTVTRIGDILGITIMLEGGDIHHFSKVSNYASYCRCVKNEIFSDGKKSFLLQTPLLGDCDRASDHSSLHTFVRLWHR